MHLRPAGGLGQQRQLGAVGQGDALGVAVDVGGAGIESGHAGLRSGRYEALHLLGHIHLGRCGGTHRGFGRDVERQRAVGGQQARLRHAVHVLQLQGLDAIAQQEQQAPVAAGHGFAQGVAHRLGVGVLLLPAVEPTGARAVQLGLGEGGVFQALDHFQQLDGQGLGVAARLGVSAQQQRAGLSQRGGKGAHAAGGFQLLHQALVQAAGRGLGHQQGDQLDCCVVGVRHRGDVVPGRGAGRATAASHGDAALAVLHRVDGVKRRQHAPGLGNGAEALLDPSQGLSGIELAADDQRGVVRLVVQLVEGLQALDADVLDVSPRTDGVFAVVVPLEHGGHQALPDHVGRVVLAHLHLVAHHRHLGVEVLLGDEAVDHRVGLPAQVPLERVGVGAEGGEVVGAVEPGGAVGGQPALGELGPHGGVLGRAFEDQVLQQVGHARLAVVLVFAAHPVGHVHRGGGFGVVGRQQHLQAVGQAVFGDAFDRAHRGQRRRWCGQGG